MLPSRYVERKDGLTNILISSGKMHYIPDTKLLITSSISIQSTLYCNNFCRFSAFEFLRTSKCFSFMVMMMIKLFSGCKPITLISSAVQPTMLATVCMSKVFYVVHDMKVHFWYVYKQHKVIVA